MQKAPAVASNLAEWIFFNVIFIPGPFSPLVDPAIVTAGGMFRSELVAP
jgi:hypothetical protein